MNQTSNWTGSFDIIVVGAGHAGCEAALISSRMGMNTLLLTMHLETIALPPCNPSIGGPAKGVVVREIDALGGEMAKNTDETMIHIRMLNTGKGYAVQAMRAQVDKRQYSFRMAHVIKNQPRLHVLCGLVEKLLWKDGKPGGVETHFGDRFYSKAVIITGGTFLRGKIYIGPVSLPSGRMGEPSSELLVASLHDAGLAFSRFKTGTPARVSRRSINFSGLSLQCTSNDPLGFSFFFEPRVCAPDNPVYMTYTNEQTHQIIRDHLPFSPLYGETKLIQGTGPRYCPSIEDKVLKFPERNRHQVFIEPEWSQSEEFYLSGVSTSLPLSAQEKMIQSMEGLEHAEIVRPAYAVEYDYLLPEQLFPTLESKAVEGLYFAGQMIGSSGYEEAAAQGLIAGINACRKIERRQPLTLGRDQAYIGVLIDDLVTKGTDEPYRLLTSRAEYRLVLRSDNAHLRLLSIAKEVGVVPGSFIAKTEKIMAQIHEQLKRLELMNVSTSEALNHMLVSKGTQPLQSPSRFLQLLKRPGITYSDLVPWDEDPVQDSTVRMQIEIEAKYRGYIERTMREIQEFRKMEMKRIPDPLVYERVPNLSTEARQKLSVIRPLSIGQAMRIPGITPADIANLLYAIRSKKTEPDEKEL